MLSTRILSEEYSIFSSILFYSCSQLLGCVLVCLWILFVIFWSLVFFSLSWWFCLDLQVCSLPLFVNPLLFCANIRWTFLQNGTFASDILQHFASCRVQQLSALAVLQLSQCFLVSWYRSYSAFVKLQWSPTQCESDWLEVPFLELSLSLSSSDFVVH